MARVATMRAEVAPGLLSPHLARTLSSSFSVLSRLSAANGALPAELCPLVTGQAIWLPWESLAEGPVRFGFMITKSLIGALAVRNCRTTAAHAALHCVFQARLPRINMLLSVVWDAPRQAPRRRHQWFVFGVSELTAVR